jgi:hypothetical protein
MEHICISDNGVRAIGISLVSSQCRKKVIFMNYSLMTIKPCTFVLQIMRCVPWPKESDYCNVLQAGMDCNGLKVERGLMSFAFFF